MLRDFHNIECRDALIAFDREEFLLDDQGKPVAHWDGKTMKVHPVTGKEVPDESQRTPVKKYINPRKAVWPEADFVIGNPPFIGAGPMRAALGDGYVEAIRGVWSEIPESADFVMFWWHHAAELTRAGKLQRFGFITTNSLRQTFNRRVVEAQLSAQNDRPSPAPALRAGATSPRKRGEVMSTLTSPRLRGEVAPTGAGEGQLIPQPLSLVFAIPDHPWVDAADGAAVRIAMTVASAGRHPGQLNEVVEERETGDDAMEVTLLTHRGIIHPDLRVGANVSSALPLRSNVGIAIKGFELGSQGFLIEKEQGDKWLKEAPELNRVVLPYMNGSDLILGRWDRYVIDFHGLTETEARKYGLAYQWVSDRVIPERKVNAEARTSKNWWLFRRSGEALRSTLSGLTKFIATTRTAKHRVFQFLPHNVVAESKIVVIATDDAGTLGILSSTIHVIWATASGAHLGVGNDPNYNHTECFDHFPFPITTPEQTITIRKLAASLDAHRKKQQAAHPELTLTALYNVLEKLKSGEPLSAKEKITHEQGLATVLKQLHDELDLAVLAAYGWSDLAPLMQIVNGNDRSRPRDDARRQLDETLLDRLVALNAERAAEEQRGLIRWLRPDFQNPQGKTAKPEPKQQEMELGADEDAATPAIAAERQPWPKELPAQVKAVAALLTASANPLTEPAIAARFTGRGPWKKRLPMILDMLVTLGRVRQTPQGYRAI